MASGNGYTWGKRCEGVIVCRGYQRTWAYPREISELLKRETAGFRVLQLFGGQADWGITIDLDRTLRPSVVGNALFPPFACETFDAVLIDPPYTRASNGVASMLICVAACLARSRVWWFATSAIGTGYHGLRLLRWWAVLPSEHGQLRVLAEFERRRHPARGCHPIPRDRWPKQLGRYNWSQEVLGQEVLPLKTELREACA